MIICFTCLGLRNIDITTISNKFYNLFMSFPFGLTLQDMDFERRDRVVKQTKNVFIVSVVSDQRINVLL